jgi:dihydrofolate synthase/folylpolyglutamate synthase
MKNFRNISIQGLSRIKSALEKLGSPQRSAKYVHVAGTNGKGSVSFMISKILEADGLRVGLFTSPHIESPNERIQLNGVPINDADFELLAEKAAATGEDLTEFEAVAAIAFLYFKRRKCDFAVLEVGLGGRLDATNVIVRPEVAVITAIDYDHMEILGDSLEKIAAEKAGIIKNDCPVVSQSWPYNIKNCIRPEFPELISRSPNGQRFNYKNYKNLFIPALGAHQLLNAATAIEAARILFEGGRESLAGGETAIAKGLRNSFWPGRIEIINRNPIIILDGSHNPGSVKALAETLSDLFPDKKVIFIAGFHKDKDYKTSLEITKPLTKFLIASTPPESERTLPPEKIPGADFVSRDLKDAVEKSLELAGKDDIICVFGSLYNIAPTRKYFGERL